MEDLEFEKVERKREREGERVRGTEKIWDKENSGEVEERNEKEEVKFGGIRRWKVYDEGEKEEGRVRGGKAR